MPAAKKSAASKTAPKRAPRSTQKWIRSLASLPLTIRLMDKSEISLAPRGARGDLYPVTKTQLEDSKLRSNIGMTVELISEAEARAIAKSQMTNQQAAAPDHILSFIRNPMNNNEAYEQETVVVDHSRTDPGDTVADLDANGMPVRRQGVGPRVATGLAGGDDEFAHLLAADDAAKSGDNIEDILGGFQVS
jgi:hypothetical protein